MMRRTYATLVLLLAASLKAPGWGRASQEVPVLKSGVYKSPTGKCVVRVMISPKGGHKILHLTNGLEDVSDVSGLGWLSRSSLAYSVSPVYGKPGIYVYNCDQKRVARIVAPRKTDGHYPHGAEYFELKVVSNGRIYFYYAPDVDEINFRSFRTKSFLHSVNSDGSDFRKITSKIKIGK